MNKDYKQIKFYEDACKVLGVAPINEQAWLDAGVPQNKIDLEKLETITKAINGGVAMDIYDEDTPRWYPWFWTNGSPSGFAFDRAYYVYSNATAGSGSRLSFLDEDRAAYAGKTFVELYRKTIE